MNIETRPFDPATFKPGEEEVYQDEQGNQRVKLRDHNVIRWRRKVKEDGTTSVESNARSVPILRVSASRGCVPWLALIVQGMGIAEGCERNR